MNRAIWWIVLILVWVAIGAAVYYWWQQKQEPQPLPPPRIEAPPPAPVEPEGQTRHPIEAIQPEAKPSAKEEAPLPSLQDSDNAAQEALASLIGRDPLAAFFESTGLIRRIVATVDNLPRTKAMPQRWPIKPTPGRFITSGGGDDVTLSAENFRRYEPFVRRLEAVDTDKLVALYKRFYPLFQQAYRELGYPKKYFNDRLVEMIDDMLAAPEVKGPIKLAKPWVMYEFADSELEARSAGQKILIRMGADNAARVKAKLREIRQRVASGVPKQ